MMLMILFIPHANVPLHNAVVGAMFDVFAVTLVPVLTCMYVHIYRYWSHEKSKGRSPKLMIALFRILWPKVLLNFFLAAAKVSQSSSCSMCTEQ